MRSDTQIIVSQYNDNVVHTTRAPQRRHTLQVQLNQQERAIAKKPFSKSNIKAPPVVEKQFKINEEAYIKHVDERQRKRRKTMIVSLVDASEELLAGIPDSESDSEELMKTIAKLETKLKHTRKRLASFRKKNKAKDDVLQSTDKLSKVLAKKQRETMETHVATTNEVSSEQLLSKTLLEDFKSKQDRVLLKYLTILFDGIYGNTVQDDTAKVKEHRLCTALELLHKAHNSKYCGIVSLRACIIAYLTTHSKVHHTLLQPVLASGCYEAIRSFVNSKLSDFRKIPENCSVLCSLDNCQKGGRIYTEGVFNKSNMKVNTALCIHTSKNQAQFVGKSIWIHGNSDLSHLSDDSFDELKTINESDQSIFDQYVNTILREFLDNRNAQQIFEDECVDQIVARLNELDNKPKQIDIETAVLKYLDEKSSLVKTLFTDYTIHRVTL
jgi:hypothetical protein